jgi:recombination protein RecA
LAIAHGVHPDKVDFEKLDLDMNNVGGLPLGKLVELYGTEGSGKSSIAYRVVGYAQKLGYNALWIDTENSFSRDLANINGVDLKKLSLANLENTEDPDKLYYAEDIMENICVACKSGFQVIILDSVAALTVKAEMENGIGEGGVGMGALAQLMSRAVKKVCNYAAKYGVLVVMINQVREKIGVMFGDPETTPGGKALKFHASIRLRLQRQFGEKGQVKVEDDAGEENLIAGKSFVQIKKNRFGKPVADSILIPIYYENYFPNIEEVLFNAGRQVKIIKPRLGIFSWGDIKAEGRANFLAKVKEENAVDRLVEEVRKAAIEQEILLPPEVLMYEVKAPKKELPAKDAKDPDERQVSRRRKGKDSNPGGTDAVAT